MKSSVLYSLHNTQILGAVITVYAVDVINLLVSLKRLDKCLRYKAMH